MTGLKEHFSTAARNASILLNINVLQLVVWRILHDVQNAEYFSVCAGEAADVGNKEQLPHVLRFVNEAGVVA